MALSVTVNATVSRIRKGADVETADQANSVVPDAEIIEYINDSYRELFEICAEYAGPERFGTSTTLTGTAYTLPADFYQLLAVDYTVGTDVRTLKEFTFAERAIQFDADRPRWRIQNGALKFNPSTFAASVTLWYVPTPAALAAGGSFDSIAGWDTYVVAYGVLKVREKQEYNTSDARADLDRAEARIRKHARLIKPKAPAMVDVRTLPDSYYYG